jgi:hypothetical protein
MMRVACARLAASSLAFWTRVYGRGFSYRALSTKSPIDLPSSGSGCKGVYYKAPELTLSLTDAKGSYLATLLVFFSYEDVPFPTCTL